VVRDLEIAAGLAERALSLNANLALSWAVSGWLKVWLGEPEAGSEHFERAMRLSPLEPDIRLGVFGAAHACFMAGRYDEAWSKAQVGMKTWQTPAAFRIAAASAALAGHGDEAAKYMRLLLTLDPTRRVSNFAEVLGPYRRAEDIEHYKQGMRLAGLPD
jgi:tetratricopeptide (TPR) repeat protein